MSQPSLTDLVTALKKYNEPSADPRMYRIVIIAKLF